MGGHTRAREARVREAFGGGPLLLDLVEPADREIVIEGLDRLYLASPLPAALVDGVLLFLAGFTRRRYPLYLHGAMLLHRGAPQGALAEWAELGGWQEPGPLIHAWNQLRGVPLTDPALHPLIGRTVGLLVHAPALGAEVVGSMRKVLDGVTVAAVLRLVELWALLGPRYRWLPRFEPMSEPHVRRFPIALEELVSAAAKAPRPIVAATPGAAESSESLVIAPITAATVLEALPIGVIRLDSKGRIGYENPAMRELLGVPSDRPSIAMGMRITDLPNMRQWTGLLEALIADGTPFDVRHVPFVSVFGKAGVVNAMGRPLRDALGQQTGSVLLSADARTEVALEEQVVALAQREIFGGLVSRIAHDLNNLLVGVRGNASLLVARLAESDPNYVVAARVDEAAQRLGTLVDGLNRLVHPTEPTTECSAADAAEVVREAGVFLQGLMPDQVALTVTCPSHAVFARVPATLLRQVLIHLGVNARDSIAHRGDGGGTITLELGVSPDGRVWVEVGDDGVARDADQVVRLFDPLEATRLAGLGQGLAMPVSRALITSHGGDITCEPRPGGGLTVLLTLEGADGPAPQPTPATTTPEGGVVLVVEDNDVVRDLCVDVLESEGYEVRCVGTGRGALAALAGGDIDIALLDVGLPDVSGTEVFAELGRRGLDLPVILTSGNSRETLGPAAAGAVFLRKPFLIPELVGAVKRLLAARTRATRA